MKETVIFCLWFAVICILFSELVDFCWFLFAFQEQREKDICQIHACFIQPGPSYWILQPIEF